MTAQTVPDVDALAAKSRQLYRTELESRGVEFYDTGDDMPDEYLVLLRELVRVQCDVEGVLLFEDYLRPILDLPPEPLDKMRMAKLHAEEFGHAYMFWKMYKELDRELTWNDFFGEGATRKAQYVFSYNYDTWTDLALLNTLTDRMGAFVFRDMAECSYLPWRKVSLQNLKDEVGHTSLGYINLKKVCDTPEGREEAQQLLYKWYPAALDMFGRSDSSRQWDYIKWGLKRSGNEELRQSYIDEVNPLLEAVGLEPPTADYNRRYL